MNEPRLSVVLCTYNGEAFLAAQLDSLLAQTRLPDEIVVSDDASTDGTWDMLQAFARRAARLGVAVRASRHERNRGFVQNFSEALQHAGGDLVFLCDQDDEWLPEKIALMAGRFREDPSLWLLCSDARLVGADGKDLHASLFDALELKPRERLALHEGRAFEVLLRRSMVTGATAAFRRQLPELALPVGENWIHDEWLAIVAAALGKVDAVEQELIRYRQHGGNQVGMRKRTLADKWRDLSRPRGEQFRVEATRLYALERRLVELRVASDYLALTVSKREHFERRIALGRQPGLARIPTILREVWRGDYGRYGTGPRSMLRDLLRHD
jgi:glycosyltransferase involved in cell wall biosynthesis